MTTSKSRGYAHALVLGIQALDPKLPQAQLGLVCIAKGIPVTDIARRLGVSRQAVYDWFLGRAVPRSRKCEDIAAFADELIAE